MVDKRYTKCTKYKPIIKRINIDLETENEDDEDDNSQDIDPPGYESAPERYYSKPISLFGLKTSSRDLLLFIGQRYLKKT